MRPDEYEQLVATHFEKQGYSVTVSSYTNDYGVDVFATKGATKIAIQAKMFGGTSRSINRAMVMELHGAKDYFDCTKAVLATNGKIIGNALEVADKLGIEVIQIAAAVSDSDVRGRTSTISFEDIWERHVMPLEGMKLTRSDGSTNNIVKVDWAGVERITSNGCKQKINIEIFRMTINHLLEHGSISRAFINDEYSKRASSGVILILSNTEIFDLTIKPAGLRAKDHLDRVEPALRRDLIEG